MAASVVISDMLGPYISCCKVPIVLATSRDPLCIQLEKGWAAQGEVAGGLDVTRVGTRKVVVFSRIAGKACSQ